MPALERLLACFHSTPATPFDPAPCRSPVIPHPQPICHHRTRRAAHAWSHPRNMNCTWATAWR
ncbi:hypothetical protein B1F73_23730 [Pseudomonas syringae]|nr:hypothetical protein B1F77_03950 [Pseudomonas syringae]RXT83882.1 hypothetical protein B1F72_17135 [Pseudomonas syringae]RXT94747.1 hypothetical protein B1F73_23730 [Pseudomonas syringae]RXU28543.1 hypothetical protein B0A92_01780 [Pseudomonas syringae]